MSSPSKRKGTTFEVAIRDHLDQRGIAAFRVAPAGARDEGDIRVPGWDAILECKATRAIDLAGALDEARVEAMNAKERYGIAVIKRRNHHVSHAYVVMALEDFIDLMEERS